MLISFYENSNASIETQALYGVVLTFGIIPVTLMTLWIRFFSSRLLTSVNSETAWNYRTNVSKTNWWLYGIKRLNLTQLANCVYIIGDDFILMYLGNRISWLVWEKVSFIGVFWFLLLLLPSLLRNTSLPLVPDDTIAWEILQREHVPH